MPVCKAEAHRALELLEDYYARLDENEEKELKVAIERVIKIFKSRLFQALLDIQGRRRLIRHFPHWLRHSPAPACRPAATRAMKTTLEANKNPCSRVQVPLNSYHV